MRAAAVSGIDAAERWLVSEFSVRLVEGAPSRPIEQIVEAAERAAFSAAALAVKLRELDAACIACEKAYETKQQIFSECRALLLAHEGESGALTRQVRT